ncbi:MAG: metalloregulator ArsR/SmtB family transcription factor [Phycisphaerales bacterium]
MSKRKPPANPRKAAACCGPLDRLLDPELFKSLADPTRLSLVACIAKCARGCSVGEIAECCSVDVSVVSRHLSLLQRSGVLDVERVGRTVLYRVRYDHLTKSLRELASAFEACCPPEGGSCGNCC